MSTAPIGYWECKVGGCRYSVRASDMPKNGTERFGDHRCPRCGARCWFTTTLGLDPPREPTDQEIEEIRERNIGEHIWLNLDIRTLLEKIGQLQGDLIKERQRVAELEDTIRLDRAQRWQQSSCGRDGTANRMLEGITARRGAEWSGAVVTNEPEGE